jgi:hypothetical protein
MTRLPSGKVCSMEGKTFGVKFAELTENERHESNS